jgi:ABC-2 type transport system ATP-binding protein
MRIGVQEDYFKINGVSNLSIKNNLYSFIYRGDINEILNKIIGLKVKNIWIEEPDLEEIFLHYYNKED